MHVHDDLLSLERVNRSLSMSTWKIISPSLVARIENLDTSKPQFSIGMSDWTDDDKENEDFQPPKE